jgi:hypothetical protein
MDSIDQPDPGRTQKCPPEKGFALIMMSAWVMPMFIVPVSEPSFVGPLLFSWWKLFDRSVGEVQVIQANREISQREPIPSCLTR